MMFYYKIKNNEGFFDINIYIAKLFIISLGMTKFWTKDWYWYHDDKPFHTVTLFDIGLSNTHYFYILRFIVLFFNIGFGIQR